MALTSPVQCLLLTVLLILTFSGKSECLTSKVKSGEKIESDIGHYRNINLIPQTVGDLKEFPDKKYFSDGFNPKITQNFALSDSGEKSCRNKLCELYSRHRERRQIKTGYSSYPQPTYPQQGQQYQNNSYRPPTNSYGNYPNVNNIYPHYPNTTQYRPINNSTYGQLPNRNNFSNPNPGYSSSSRHTYPPSPRPLYNQYPTNNLSQNSNNLYPYNKNSNPMHNPTHNSNYYPSYNGNSYPNINTNSSYPRFVQNNTRQTFNYPNNYNTMPNHYPSNVTPNPYNRQQNNSLPYNNFNQRAPSNPYPNQRNANSTYPHNLTPTSGMNSTGVYNYNSGPYYPTQNFTPNTPYGTNPNLAQNKFPSNPIPYYHSNYSGPPYDPLRQPPHRLSYK